MNDNVNLRIELAKEAMSLSAIYLLIRLGLKKMTVEEWYQLKIRTERYHRLVEVLNL